MLRTQISLTEEERRLLDVVASRTGRSISSLIRQAVQVTYGAEHSTEDDLDAMREAFGSWQDDRPDSADWVDQLRPGTRFEHTR